MRGRDEDREPQRRAKSDEWWEAVLAGDPSVRHPIHGDDLKVKLRDGRLVLSGEVPTKRDRDQLVRDARLRIGNGLHEYDVSGLKIRRSGERPGVLMQTLVAAFDRRDTALLALKFLKEHAPSEPLRAEVLDKDSKLGDVLPREALEDSRKQIERGMALIVIDVDETDAYRVRSILEEDTRSTWTVAAPPRLIHGEGN